MADNYIEQTVDSLHGSPHAPNPLVPSGTFGASPSLGLSPIPAVIARGGTVHSDDQFAALQRATVSERQARAAARDAQREKNEAFRARFEADQLARARDRDREREQLAHEERIRRSEESEVQEEQRIRAQEDERLQAASPDKSYVPGIETSWAGESNLRRPTLEEQFADQRVTNDEQARTIASLQRTLNEMRAAVADLSQDRRTGSGYSPPPMIRLRSDPRSTQLSYTTALSNTPTRPRQDPGPQASSFEFSRPLQASLQDARQQPLNPVESIPFNQFADMGQRMQERGQQWQENRRNNQAIAPYSPDGPFALPPQKPSSHTEMGAGAVPAPVHQALPHDPDLVTEHPTNPLLWMDGRAGARNKLSTPFTTRDRPIVPESIHLPSQSGSVRFSKAKEESEKFQVLYGSTLHTWPLCELQVFYAVAGHCARTRDFVSLHIFDILSLCSSNLIKDALQVCISDNSFNWTSFRYHLSTPSKFEQSTSPHSFHDLILKATGGARMSGGKEWGLYSDLSLAEKQALPFDLFGHSAGEVASGTLISALYTVAGKVLGGPTREELQTFSKGMIIMGDPHHTDPYHTVPSDEGPLGVLQRILYIYHLFLSGPDRSWVQEDLTSLSFALIKAFSRAITLSARPELHATFLRLMDEGPSARNASDIVRIGMCIKKLQSVFDNSESIVMRDLHRHQRASPFTAVPAVGSGHPSLRLPDPVPAVPALSTPGFIKRTYFPRKPMAAAPTDFDAPSDDEDPHSQDEALVAASTQAGMWPRAQGVTDWKRPSEPPPPSRGGASCPRRSSRG